MGEGTYSKVKHCTWTKPGETPPEKKARAIKQLILETIKKTGFDRRQKIAIKIINKKTAPKDFLEKFLPRELEILRKVIFLAFFIFLYFLKVHHPNVVQTFEIITINHKVFIALEWAGKGDLLAFVRLRGSLKENDCRRIFTEMSAGTAPLVV